MPDQFGNPTPADVFGLIQSEQQAMIRSAQTPQARREANLRLIAQGMQMGKDPRIIQAAEIQRAGRSLSSLQQKPDESAIDFRRRYLEAQFNAYKSVDPRAAADAVQELTALDEQAFERGRLVAEDRRAEEQAQRDADQNRREEFGAYNGFFFDPEDLANGEWGKGVEVNLSSLEPAARDALITEFNADGKQFVRLEDVVDLMKAEDTARASSQYNKSTVSDAIDNISAQAALFDNTGEMVAMQALSPTLFGDGMTKSAVDLGDAAVADIEALQGMAGQTRSSVLDRIIQEESAENGAEAAVQEQGRVTSLIRTRLGILGEGRIDQIAAGAGVTPTKAFGVDNALSRGIASMRLLKDEDKVQAEAWYKDVMEAQVLSLAYVLAKAQDPGGRLSDKDVDLAIMMVGGNTTTRKAAWAIIDKTILNTAEQRLRGEASKFGLAVPGPDGTFVGIRKAGENDGEEVHRVSLAMQDALGRLRETRASLYALTEAAAGDEARVPVAGQFQNSASADSSVTSKVPARDAFRFQ